MRKGYLVILLPLLVFALAGTSYAWQGRMGGMGDPYGLVADESDFLSHPAKIAKGEGVRLYGDYRFAYTGVMDWDYDLDRFDTTGTVLTGFFHFDGSGEEYNHNTLLGAGFPLGPGRMGFFFTYDGMSGDYDGDEDIMGVSNYAAYDLTKKLDNLALRLLYGLPIGDFNVGGEIQFAHREDEQATRLLLSDLSAGFFNYPISLPDINLYPYMFAGDWQYWEALFKGSAEGKVGPAHVALTVRGGMVLAGDSSFEPELQSPVGNTAVYDDLDGDVGGWRIGGDLWVRYPLGDTVSLPFVVRVDYKERERDGVGSILPEAYELREEALELEAGGGVDWKFGNSNRVAAGVYYSYLDGNIEYSFTNFEEDDNYPARTEHRVSVRLAGEHEFSQMFALRMGVDVFYGWVQEDYERYDGIFTDNISLHGSRWGIGASVGGTIKFKPITLEPFINGGYQMLDLNCNGTRSDATGALINLWDMTRDRSEWSVGGGLSVLFDL